LKLERLVKIPARHKFRVPVQIVTWTKVKGVEDLVQGVALNISLGGMLLYVPINLSPDMKLDLSFRLPGDLESLSAVGKIVWRDKINQKCGVEFIAQRGDFRERLARFIDETFEAYNKAKISGDYDQCSQKETDWEILVRTSDARKRAIMNAAFDCIIAVDQEDRILEFNEAAEQAFGFSKNDMLLHRALDKLLPSSLCKSLRGQLFDFVAKEESSRHEIIEDHARRANGTLFPVEIRALSTYVEREALLVLYIRDISERKKMLTEYKRSAQLAALGTIAAGVAHEVNNPLQGILNYATLIHQYPERTDKTIDLSQRIIKESTRINHISKNLLYYSKANQTEISYCDIRECVESVLYLMETKLCREGFSIERSYADNLPKIPINPQGIQQVVTNLIDNAFDAMRAKDLANSEKVIDVNLSVHEEEDAHLVCIQIYDRGVGMPEEVLRHAKDVFFSTKPSAQGTGLGLSIVSDIVEDHKGSLHIESVAGEYTKVKVFLPFA
jgi:PAS domain S-box-containing protein